jgi:AcrR family transcriptional regulator
MKKTPDRKRKQGRPAGQAVGRETVLRKAAKLVQEMPPSRVTLALVARAAGVDPALIRYYFGSRENLLLAVVDRLIAGAPKESAPGAQPLEFIEFSVRNAARFTRSTKHVHRLMVDELADARSAAIRQRQGEMNRRAVDSIRQVFEQDRGQQLRAVNPLFLHLALVGLFDFYASAQPVVRNLVPAGTDLEQLGRQFEDFVVDLVLNGVRRR